ncbi:AMP-binding protein [Paenibacillus sediminis]|uniref:Acyl-CoA synthetase (AMP-forming)/AMP-acid ligase II n=1 Tax=Paenibacillus sediminis TaxID=664909 RepID=A0ABS4H1B7_9BACL|nr:acyl-CoA synthetase (AMP-forming)/AMP-acid ligase II [Paenibacillus sediminis]
MNISAYLSMNARKYPCKEALIMGQDRISFEQWEDTANRMAYHLHSLGIDKNDKVVMMMPNCLEFAVMYMAVIRCGAIIIPINIRSTKDEVTYIVEHSNAKGIIVHDTVLLTVEDIRLSTNVAITITTGAGSDNWIGLSSLTLSKSEHKIKGLTGIVHTFSEDNEVSILYTSGTTGKPKGVLFTHRNLLTVATMMIAEMNIKHDSRILQLMPLSHSAPLHLLFIAGIISGATQVLAPAFSPDLLLELTEKEQITHFFGAPVAYLLTMKHSRFMEYDLSSVRYWIYGGAPLSTEMAQSMERGYGREKLVSVYGLTEAGPSGACLFHAEHPDKVGSIGNRGVLFTELEVVNEHGVSVKPDEIGEIRIRGEGNMKEYVRNTEATKDTLRDGWVYSGDLAKVDEDGFIWVIDRKKDVVITGGVNVFPKEIETVLGQHPAIQELAVVGVPHPEWGESIKACLVIKEDEWNKGGSVKDWRQEVHHFLQGKIADYKIPHLVECIPSLPRNSNGKILKHVLRK